MKRLRTDRPAHLDMRPTHWGVLVQRRSRSFQLLLKALKQNEWGIDKGVHTVAIYTLGQIGPAAKPVLPAMVDAFGEYLKRAKPDGNQEITGPVTLSNSGALPRTLVESLKKIDPDVREVLPKAIYENGVFWEGVARDRDESMKLWQETYRALKKKYPGPVAAPLPDTQPGAGGSASSALKQELARFEGTWLKVAQRQMIGPFSLCPRGTSFRRLPKYWVKGGAFPAILSVTPRIQRG